MPGLLIKKDGGIIFKAQEFEYKVGRITKECDSLRERDVILGIRPENVTILADPLGNDSIEGKVQQTQLVGPDLILYVLIGGKTQLCCRVDPRFGFQKGDRVFVAFPHEQLLMFDPETTQALGEGIVHGFSRTD